MLLPENEQLIFGIVSMMAILTLFFFASIKLTQRG